MPNKPMGHEAAVFMAGRIMSVNLVNWTVDVISQYDRHYFYDIQVASPYMHYNQGEGVFAVPDIGAMCMICVPSDSSPPFVAGYVMPMEVVGGTGKPETTASQSVVTNLQGVQSATQVTGTDAPDGTRSRGGQVPYPNVDARFDGGRPPAKSGDIFLRGRDGNFLTLHRGGVLQIGASEIAQRIYIPLLNKVLDISGDYEHQNTGGAIRWAMQEGPSVDNPAVQHMSTYRIFANDQYCDLRIAKGKVLNPVLEPPGNAFGADDLASKNIGTKDNPVVYEITLAPGGFKVGSGDLSDFSKIREVKMHFLFDRNGGMFLRAEGHAVFRFKKDLKVTVDGDMALSCASLTIVTKKGMRIGGGPVTQIDGDTIKIGGGTQAIARMGDSVLIPPPLVPVVYTVVAGTPNLPSGTTFSVLTPNPTYGSVASGNPNVTA